MRSFDWSFDGVSAVISCYHRIFVHYTFFVRPDISLFRLAMFIDAKHPLQVVFIYTDNLMLGFRFLGFSLLGFRFLGFSLLGFRFIWVFTVMYVNISPKIEIDWEEWSLPTFLETFIWGWRVSCAIWSLSRDTFLGVFFFAGIPIVIGILVCAPNAGLLMAFRLSEAAACSDADYGKDYCCLDH